MRNACKLTSIGIVGHSTNRLRRRSHDDFEASLTQQMKVPISDDTTPIYCECVVSTVTFQAASGAAAPVVRLYDTEAAEAEDYVMRKLNKQQSLLDDTSCGCMLQHNAV
jgi:hypothetical protein